MGIREEMNKRPRAVAVAGVVALAVGIAAMAFQLSSGGIGRSGEQAFYTTDDGATWFTDAADRLPPFDYKGKEAVRAYVFECNGKPFVNHLERWTPDRRKL